MTVPTGGGGAWRPSDAALAQSSDVYHGNFPPLDLQPLSGWLSSNLEICSPPLTEHSAIYSDALYDLSLLIEEVSFEASLAVVYIAGLSAELHPASGVAEFGARLGMAREVLALLSPYRASVPPPEMLFIDPAHAIAGHRLLGGWYAGQLLDSALIRSLAALDRVAILLWCAAGLPIRRDQAGDLRLPAFREGYLDSLDASYKNVGGWPQLRGLASNPYMKLVKPYRDGFVHRRRFPMQLHGEHAVVSDSLGSPSTTRGLDAEDHLALVLAFYAEILDPAVRGAGEVILA